MTSACLLAVAALAGHFHSFPTGSIRTIAIMTRSIAFMGAIRPWRLAALFANLPGSLAGPIVAWLDALMAAATQILVAR